MTGVKAVPDDIYPESGNRLPPPKRESLDEARQKDFDHNVSGRTLAGLRGPGGLQLYSPVGPLISQINQYLRFGSGIGAALREIAILTTAREASNQFEWTMHEPAALKEGVAPEVIDLIKHRKPVSGIPDEQALIIRLGRAIFADRKVPSDLFAEACAQFGDHRLVDIVLLMGNYAATAALLTAFDMQLPSDRPPLLPTES
jgi:4-carboxymuconolactone decarboxylase